MRLIDADKLMENKFKNDISYNAFCNLVKRQPSIDAVKHGRWKEVSDDMYAGGGAWICSSCHYGFSWEAYSLIPEEKYCPHCGARMDGEDDG